MPEKLSVSIDDLTLGEAEFFETETGISLEDMENFRLGDSKKDAKKPALPIKALTTLVCIAKRRSDPDFTMEQARNLKVSELDLEDPDENPTRGDS